MQHNPKLGGVFLGGSLAVLAALSGVWSKVLGVSQPIAIAGLVVLYLLAFGAALMLSKRWPDSPDGSSDPGGS